MIGSLGSASYATSCKDDNGKEVVKFDGNYDSETLKNFVVSYGTDVNYKSSEERPGYSDPEAQVKFFGFDISPTSNFEFRFYKKAFDGASHNGTVGVSGSSPTSEYVKCE